MENETEQVQKRKEFMNEFENMLKMSELKALSTHSLEQPLSEKQFKRIMELKKELTGDVSK